MMDIKDKCTEILREEREALIQILIERLDELKEDFYKGHIHIDKESMLRKINEIWDNYHFEMKYRKLKALSEKKED